MLKPIQALARAVLLRIEAVFDGAFGAARNPFYHLGALAFFFFWIVAVSGIYLYIFFETSILGAYRSIEYLTHEQWYLGGVMRSLHRYASDAMVVAAALHMLREFAFDRLGGVRWYSWVTGVMLLWFLYASGIGGYWLVWDELAQYVAIVTAEWLDWLPLFSEPIARNFLSQDTVSDRFFSLLSFLHIGIPLLLLLGMWIHIQRISRARTNPPRALAVGTLLALLVLSVVHPALSQAPANLDRAVGVVHPDWFYLAVYPLVDHWSAGGVWALLGGGTLLLTLLPWLPPARRAPVAVVSLANCNGCGRCFADCPYSAVILEPRTDGLPFEQQAQVDPALCVSCGICVGACPTAMPFRRSAELVAGVELPELPVRELRAQTLARTAELQGQERLLVYTCRFGADPAAFRQAGAAVLELACVGALPPAFIDFVLSRRHADGVVLAGCRNGDCRFRFGIDWTEQRLAGQRDPQLRRRVPRQRITTLWLGRANPATIEREMAAFRARLRALGPYRRDETGPPDQPEEQAVEIPDGAD